MSEPRYFMGFSGGLRADFGEFRDSPPSVHPPPAHIPRKPARRSAIFTPSGRENLLCDFPLIM
jgi:hypothetical protein